MKLLGFLFYAFLLPGGKKIPIKENYDYNNLKGNVKLVVTYNYQIFDSKKTLEQIDSSQYLSNGKISQEIFYNPEDKKSYKNMYAYDIQGNLILHLQFGIGESFPSFKTKYKYDSIGNNIERSESNRYDSVTYYVKNEFNGKQELIKETYYVKDSVTNITIYKYDNYGNKIFCHFNDKRLICSEFYSYNFGSKVVKSHAYDTCGALITTAKTEYDKNGNLIKEQRISLYSISKYRHSYDKRGNKINESGFSSLIDKPNQTSKINRVFRYHDFDKKGNWHICKLYERWKLKSIKQREIAYY